MQEIWFAWAAPFFLRCFGLVLLITAKKIASYVPTHHSNQQFKKTYDVVPIKCSKKFLSIFCYQIGRLGIMVGC